MVASQPVRMARNAGFRWLLVVGIVLLLGLPSLVYPFGRDQGEYAYIATAALAGKVVYRDVFNVKPPLTHAVHALALLLFGRSMLAIRLLDLLWQGATALVVMRIAERTSRRAWAGVAAAALYALSYYFFDFWNTAQTDGFISLPVALAVLAFLVARERDRRWAYFASGAALGVAALFKYPIAALLPMLAALALVPFRPHGFVRAACLVLGFFLPLGICLGVLAGQGALGAFVITQTRYIPQYTAGRNAGAAYPASAVRVLSRLSWANLLLWPGTLLAVLHLRFAVRRNALDRTLPVLLWWLAAAVSYAVQNKGFLYHALPLLAPQAVIAAQALCDVLGGPPAAKLARYAIVGLAEILVLLPLVGSWWRGYPAVPAAALARVAAGERTLAEVYQDAAISGSGEPGFSLQTETLAARYIRDRSASGDTVFVWGFEPTVYFLSGRACASRFLYSFVLYGQWSWPELREALMSDLADSRPVYIVVARDDALPAVTGSNNDSEAALAGFVPLADLIASQYRLETSIGNLALYRRAD